MTIDLIQDSNMDKMFFNSTSANQITTTGTTIWPNNTITTTSTTTIGDFTYVPQQYMPVTAPIVQPIIYPVTYPVTYPTTDDTFKYAPFEYIPVVTKPVDYDEEKNTVKIKDGDKWIEADYDKVVEYIRKRNKMTIYDELEEMLE